MKIYLVWFDNMGELELIKIFVNEDKAHDYCLSNNVDSEVRKGVKYYVEPQEVEL